MTDLAIRAECELNGLIDNDCESQPSGLSLGFTPPRGGG